VKFLIVPTQQFSGTVKAKARIMFSDLPVPVQHFLSANKGKVLCGLDESSWIKTNTAIEDEQKKSQRTRLIKSLVHYTENRFIMTGTLKTKSPINVIDQYQFLDDTLFNEPVADFAEKYIIMINLRTARGKRIQIPQAEYKRIRKRMANAYKQGGDKQLEYSMGMIARELSIDREKLWHICAHKRYSPFLLQNELMSRVADITTSVERWDVMDISKDKYVYEPIPRPVQMSEKNKKLANQLIEVGFLDTIVLGKAPALELSHRLKDICNGFLPIENRIWKGEKEVREITYAPLDENPKLDELLNLLDEIGVEENQVVIWCYRKNAFRGIAQALEDAGIDVVRYSGDETDREKDDAEERFESGVARVFLANEDAAGFGLNCLKLARYMIWYSCGDSAEKHNQAMHRILREESKELKFAYSIFIENSVEERNIDNLNVGQELITDANSKSVFWFD
jgi:hypothetical protein